MKKVFIALLVTGCTCAGQAAQTEGPKVFISATWRAAELRRTLRNLVRPRAKRCGEPGEWADVPAMIRTAKHVVLLAGTVGAGR